MATAPSPNDLTRQQLDELDSLLQRMLSVPLPPPDTPLPGEPGSAPPLPPTWRVDPPAPGASASLPHLVLDDPASASVKSESPPAPKPAAKAPAPPVAKAAPTAAVAAPSSAPVPQPTVPVMERVAAIAPAPAAAPLPVPLLPLAALNALFDGICGLLGPPGRLLRSGFLKDIYGLTGLGLLLYTAAHVAQVQGWIALPVTLPWPR